MATVYLGLGSNIGDRLAFIRKALTLIAERVGEILTLSNYYESPPWGYDSTASYQNLVLAISTELNPLSLLTATLEIEKKVGRQHKTLNGNYQDREIDIDILLYDDLILQTPALTIPHPLMHQRPFVLKPLAEIAPHLIHPILKKSIAELYFF